VAIFILLFYDTVRVVGYKGKIGRKLGADCTSDSHVSANNPNRSLNRFSNHLMKPHGFLHRFHLLVGTLLVLSPGIWQAICPVIKQNLYGF